MDSKKPKRPRSQSVPNTEKKSEANEVQAFVAGLKSPWEEFRRTQSERLFRIAVEVGVPPDRIADVLQEVWLDLAKHHEDFPGEDTEQLLSSWLGKVVRSKSRDALRRLRRGEESLDEQPAEPVDQRIKEAAELMEAKERDEHVAAQLEELRKENPRNCRLVREHIMQGRSLQDLAAETGLSVHSISCRISRSLKKLRHRLRE